jgi:hypothetical protein
VSSLPGVCDRHIHALFRFHDVPCTGAISPDELADAVYGEPSKSQEQLIGYAWQALP